ncbi:MAG: DUF1648 domain-containing protein [Cyclobacteriaceae bacterium]|nr:DUF1648 domain-containing protein [Cyclobacteriaceae bacterium]
MSSRPKIEIKRTRFDFFLEIVAVCAVLVGILFPSLSYRELPTQVPVHFDFTGVADGYGHKSFLLLLMGIELLLFLLLFFVARYPHHFNYPVRITQENARHQYRNAVLLVRSMNAVICVFYSFLTTRLVQLGLGVQHNLGFYTTSVFVSGLFLLLFYFIYRSYAHR